jgi:hypothetical protein
LDRQVGGLFTLEDATCVKSDLSVILDQARSITDESARDDILTKRIHARNPIACCECSDLLNPVVEKGITAVAASVMGLKVQMLKASSDREIDTAFASLARTGALLVIGSKIGLFGFSRKPIA